MNDQRGCGPARPPTTDRRAPARIWLAGLGAGLFLPFAVYGAPHAPEPTPSVVTTPSGHAVPTVAASVVASVKAPHAPDPKLVKAPVRPILLPSAQHRLQPDGLGIRTHDPSLRETIREVAEERTAHDALVERHNQEAQVGIHQTLVHADAMIAQAAREREAHEGFWYHLFHGR